MSKIENPPNIGDDEALKNYEAEKMGREIGDSGYGDSLPEVPKVESIQEKNQKIVQDFESETQEIEKQEKMVEDKIIQLEGVKENNAKLNVPSSISQGVERDISEMQTKRTEMQADLKSRGPSENEQMISGEIQKIETRINNIKEAEKQDPPGGAMSQIVEGRKKDIEELEKQKNKMAEELDAAKVEKIKKYNEGKKETTENKPPVEEEGPREGGLENKPEEGGEKEPTKEGAKNERVETQEQEAGRVMQRELVKTFSEFTDEVKFQEGSDKVFVKNREKAETLYGKAGGLVKALTGGDFDKRVYEEAKKQAEGEGHKVRTKAEYFSPERKAEAIKREKQAGWDEGLRAAWANLSPKEQAKYNADSQKDEKLKVRPEPGLRMFARELSNDRKELVADGYNLSPDVYYKMFKDGLDPRTIKEKGWFGKSVEIRDKDGKKVNYCKEKDFDAIIAAKQKEINEAAEKEADKKMAEGFARGSGKWQKRKLIKAGEVVMEVTKDYQATMSPDVGPIKPVSEMVKIETVTFEQQEQVGRERVEGEYQKRKEKFDQEIGQLAAKLRLTPEQKVTLDECIDKGNIDEKSLPFIDKALLKELQPVVDKKREIDKRKEDGFRAIDDKKMARDRDTLAKTIDALKGV